MSTIDTGAPASAPSSSPAPGPPPEPAAAAPSGEDVFAELPADQPIFDRGWVDKVRREGQRYREEARTTAEKLGSYDSVFGGYEQADRDVWFNLAQTWATDPVRAAQMMGAIANTVLGDQTPPAGGGAGASSDANPEGAGTTPTAPLDGELTAERVQQMITEALGAQQAQYQQAEQTRAEQAAINEVYGEVRQAGYDPDSMEGFMVLWLANNNTGGDISAAAQALSTYRQGIVDEYVSGRRSGVTPMPSGGASAAPEAAEIKNLDDARRAADAYLRSQAQ